MTHRHLATWIVATLVTLAGMAGPAAAETRVGGSIDKDTVWTKLGSPYIASKDIVVPAGVTLRIEGGVTVRFRADINDMHGVNSFDLEMIVDGNLVIQGAAKDTVYLTTDNTVSRRTDWQGVVVQDGGVADITAAKIEYCNEAVRVGPGGTARIVDSTLQLCANYGLLVTGGKATLDGCIVTAVGNSGGTGYGVYAQRGAEVIVHHSFLVANQQSVAYLAKTKGSVERTVISHCVGPGVTVRNANPTFRYNTITGNEYGLYLSAGAQPVVSHNNIFENAKGEILVGEYGSPVKLDLANNWWGDDTVQGHIDSRIIDALDDPDAGGVVLVDPRLLDAIILEDDQPTPPAGPESQGDSGR